MQGKVESAMLSTRRCNLAAYLNDHQYCKDGLETIMLNRINKVTIKEIKRIENKNEMIQNYGIELGKHE